MKVFPLRQKGEETICLAKPDKICALVRKDGRMNRGAKFLLCAALLLAGTVIGFLLAPAKKGIFFGNYSGNSYYGKNEPEPSGNPDTQESDGGKDEIPF